jgi:hypothetical protein
MPNDPCDTCPTLRAEIGRLTAERDRFRDQLDGLRGDVAQIIRRLDQETETPTKPLFKLVSEVRNRLRIALAEAGGPRG